MQYLDITEESAYHLVTADQYEMRIMTDGVTAETARIYDLTGTQVYTIRNQAYHSGQWYCAGYYDSTVLTINENEPSRVVIKYTGNLETSAGTTLSNSTSFEVYFYLYSQYFITEIIWVTADAISLEANDSGILFLTADSGFGIDGPTGDVWKYEDEDEETIETSNTDRDSAKYYVIESNELNIQVITILEDYTGTTSLYHKIFSDNTPYNSLKFEFRSSNVGTVSTTETHRFIYAYYFDVDLSYTEAERLAIGVQWTSGIDATINIGTPDTTYNIPDNIDTDGLTSAGDRQIVPHWDTVRMTFKQDEVAPALALPDASFFSGDINNPENLLVGHWKCNDNEASTIIVDSTGNYDGTLVGGDNTSDKTTTDALRGTAFELNGTDDSIDLSSALAGITDHGAVTVMGWIKPNWSEEIVNTGVLWGLYRDTSNQIYLTYANISDLMTLVIEIGGVSHNTVIKDFSGLGDEAIQQRRFFIFSLNLDQDFAYFEIVGTMPDGSITKIIETDITTSLGGDFTYFHFGSLTGSTYNCALTVEDIKLFNGCIIPYGATQHNLVQDSTGGLAHDSILFHWDMEDEDDTSPNIGTASSLTKYGSPDMQDGPYGSSDAIRYDASGEYHQMASSGNIDISKGCISFWMKSIAAFSSSTIRYYFGKLKYASTYGSGNIGIDMWSNNKLVFYVVDSSDGAHQISWSSRSAADDNFTDWNYWQFCWDSTNPVHGTHHLALFKNGVHIPSNGGDTAAEVPWTDGTADEYYGIGTDIKTTARYANAIMKDFTISDNPDPRVGSTWSVMGSPLYTSRLRVNSTDMILGSDYEATRLPNGDELIIGPTTTNGSVWELAFAMPDKGLWNTDFENSIGIGGFASDGTFALQTYTDDVAKITFPRTRINTAIKIDPIFTSGDRAVDYLVAHYKCDDNTDSSIVKDETGINNATWKDTATQSSRNTNLDSTDGVTRGRGLDTKEAAFIDITCGDGTDFDNDFYKLGTIICKAIPQFDLDTSQYGVLFELNVGTEDDRIVIFYDAEGDYFTLLVEYGAGGGIFNSDSAFISNEGLQRPFVFHVAWDYAKSQLFFAVGGKIIVSGGVTWGAAASASHPSKFIFGTEDSYTALEGDYIFDDIKIFNDYIVDYGATAHNLAQDDTGASAHESILFYWDCDISGGSAPWTANIAAGTSSITEQSSGDTNDVVGVYGRATEYLDEGYQWVKVDISDGNIYLPEGTISFWYKFTGSNEISGFIHSDGGIALSVYTNFFDFGFQTTSYITFTGVKALLEDRNWHYIQACWSEALQLRTVYVNGLQGEIEDDSFDTSLMTTTELRFGSASNWGASDGIIDEITITNSFDPRVGSAWSAMGVPLDTPLFKVNDTYQTYGGEYEFSRLTNGDLLVTSSGTQSVSDTWEITYEFTEPYVPVVPTVSGTQYHVVVDAATYKLILYPDQGNRIRLI